MTTHIEIDSQLIAGSPVMLLEIVIGSGSGSGGEIFRYVNAPLQAATSISTSAPRYKPARMDRGSAKISADVKDADLKIRIERSAGICDQLIPLPPQAEIIVRVMEAHVVNPKPSGVVEGLATSGSPLLIISDALVIFVGRLLVASVLEGAQLVELTIESVITALHRPGLRRHYSAMCHHVLYGPRCMAVKRPEIRTVVSSSGRGVRLSQGLPGAPTIWIGGTISWAHATGTETRSITEISSTDLVLNAPVSRLATGGQATILKGCAHTIEACREVHQNVRRFGGFPKMPSDNPVNRSFS